MIVLGCKRDPSFEESGGRKWVCLKIGEPPPPKQEAWCLFVGSLNSPEMRTVLKKSQARFAAGTGIEHRVRERQNEAATS